MPGDGTGGGDGAGTGTQQQQQQQRRGPRIKQRRRRDFDDERSDYTDRLVHKYGSKDKALEVLGAELFELREERREQDAEIDKLTAKQVPEGAVVLTGAKADAWKKLDAFATETKLPDDKVAEKLIERVKKADELEAKDAKATRSAARKSVATAADMNGDVLDPLLDQFGLEVENREIQVQGADGKLTPKQVAHVRKAGDPNAAWEKLTDFAARDGSPLKPFAVALAKKPEGGTTTAGTTTTFPEQTGGTPGGDTNSLIEARLARNKEQAKVDPLKPIQQKAS